MADCLATQGWLGPDCSEKFNAPGLDVDTVYIGNRIDVAAFISIVPGEISAITMVALASLYKIVFHKDSASIGEELVSAANAGSSYTQNVTARTIDDSTAVRVAIEEYVNVNMIVIVKKKNGKFFLVGENGGVKLSENVKTSGATSGDDTGDTLIWTGIGLGKMRQVFDTDEATTQALLDSYVL